MYSHSFKYMWFSNIWQQQEPVNEKWIKNAVAQRLFKHGRMMFNSSKGKIYRSFELDFGFRKTTQKN